jgi:hypothetical protein
MKWFVEILLTFWMVPGFLPAGMGMKDQAHIKTWKAFNDVADKKYEEIKAIFFGPITKILGVLGICYGFVSLLMGNRGQMITCAGIGLLITVIPYFVDSIFGAMLPG